MDKTHCVIFRPLLDAVASHWPGAQPFRFEIGPGWIGLVRDCHDALVAEFPQYELRAVKQKVAELAFQAWPRSRGPREAWGSDAPNWTEAEYRQLCRIEDRFAVRSQSICERCGGPGILRETRQPIWDMTLCDPCEAAVPMNFIERVRQLQDYMRAFNA